jgi:hypothetical protein
LQKYGVDNPAKLDFIKEKTKQSNLQKYGVDNPAKLDFIKEKTKQSNLINYNVNHFTQSNKYKIKSRKTYVENIFDKIKDLVEVDNDNNYIIKCDCKKNHVYITNNRLYYQRKNKHTVQCTICNPIDKNSGLELLLSNFIKENYDGCIIENDRTFLSGKELDVYLPDLKLAFEFNGIYWHNELYKSKYYHYDKTNSCQENGIQLIHIYEDDWIYKENIIKSIILNKLGKISDKIFAENTEIREISDNILIRDFLNSNHIQGYIKSKIKIGLFYNEELVSLMIFANLAKTTNCKLKEISYEIVRYCNKLNTDIIGGESKIFKYFIEKYNPKEVISYVNRSNSNGILFESLGFNLVRITKPNYYYVVDGIRKPQSQFRKNVLVNQGFDKNKTEHEIMSERNIFRIFNSGYLKFIFINNQ